MLMNEYAVLETLKALESEPMTTAELTSYVLFSRKSSESWWLDSSYASHIISKTQRRLHKMVYLGYIIRIEGRKWELATGGEALLKQLRSV